MESINYVILQVTAAGQTGPYRSAPTWRCAKEPGTGGRVHEKYPPASRGYAAVFDLGWEGVLVKRAASLPTKFSFLIFCVWR